MTKREGLCYVSHIINIIKDEYYRDNTYFEFLNLTKRLLEECIAEEDDGK